MAAWRLADCLVVCSAEVRYLYPGTVIGTIGNEQHQQENSDHNPNDFDVVCAIDIMLDAQLTAERMQDIIDRILLNPHPDLTYIIFNHRMWHRKNGFKPVAHESDPHTDHAHISVGVGSDGFRKPPYDDLDGWGIAMGVLMLISDKDGNSYVCDGIRRRKVDPKDLPDVKWVVNHGVKFTDNTLVANPNAFGELESPASVDYVTLAKAVVTEFLRRLSGGQA